MKPTRRAFLAGLLASAASASGCARRPMPARAERDGAGRVVLRFWNGFTGPDGKTMEKIVRKFQDENNDIVVKMQIIPWGTYYDKLTLALAYGGAPEVFIMPAARLPEFASFDTLRPLEDHFATAGAALAEDRFAPVPWKATFFNNRHVALPLDTFPLGLYYNTELFEKAGIVDARGRAKPPTNWDEFLDAAQRITKDTDGDGRPDRWGYVITYQRTNWIGFTSQWGGGILTSDLKRAAMNSPENLAGTNLMRDLIYKHKVAPKPEGIDAWLAFRQGRVGMAMEGIYMLSSLEEQTGLKFAGAPIPQFGPRPGTWGGSHTLCQPKGISDEASRFAWRLMRYLSDHSLAWAKGGQVPARRDILESAAFRALPVQSQFGRQLAYVEYDPLTPRANAINPFVDPAIEAVLLDLQTPEQAFRDADRRIDQVLSRP